MTVTVSLPWPPHPSHSAIWSAIKSSMPMPRIVVASCRPGVLISTATTFGVDRSPTMMLTSRSSMGCHRRGIVQEERSSCRKPAPISSSRSRCGSVVPFRSAAWGRVRPSKPTVCRAIGGVDAGALRRPIFRGQPLGGTLKDEGPSGRRLRSRQRPAGQLPRRITVARILRPAEAT
jgi:hypothetical protein